MMVRLEYTPENCIAIGYGMQHREDPLTPYGIQRFIEQGDVEIIAAKNNRYRVTFSAPEDGFTSISYPFPEGMVSRL